MSRWGKRAGATALALGVTAIAPAAAQAVQVSYDGTTVVYAAEAGDKLNANVGYATTGCQTTASCVTFYGDTVTYPTAHCNNDGQGQVRCDLLAGGAVRVIGGPAADYVAVYEPDIGGFPADSPFHITIDGAANDDRIIGGATGETLGGGPGFDQIDGHGGDDVINGGDDGDTLTGGDGADQLYGDAGNDTLTGDEHGSTQNTISSDLLDGGAGQDKIKDDWYRFDGDAHDADPPPTVTMDGVANDGRPGESDNVVNVEEIDGGEPDGGARYVGDDAANTLSLFGPGVLVGNGGDDKLLGSDGADSIDGGAGNDQIGGGFGNDTLTGGPGQDTISGDRTAACFAGPIFGTCTVGTGNDTINAVDGEADNVDCGPGTDVANVDAVDIVANCEVTNVTGGGTPPPPPGGTGGGGAGGGGGGGGQTADDRPAPAVLTLGRLHLAQVARKRQLPVRCRLQAAGRCTIVASIRAKDARKLHLKVKRKAKTFTLGRGSATLLKAGTKTVKVKLSRKTASRLRHARKLRVTLRSVVTDADGHRRSSSKALTLRR